MEAQRGPEHGQWASKKGEGRGQTEHGDQNETGISVKSAPESLATVTPQ